VAVGIHRYNTPIKIGSEAAVQFVRSPQDVGIILKEMIGAPAFPVRDGVTVEDFDDAANRSGE
jgi:hypothetical protein